MKNSVKLVSIVLCFVMLIGITSGCAGAKSTPTGSNAASSSPATAAPGSSTTAAKPLVINCLNSNNATTVYTITMEALAKKYAETHPGFEFKQEIIADGNAYLQKLKILASSNTLTDWFFGDPDTFMLGLREKGILTNLGDLIKELGVEDKLTTIAHNYHLFEDGTLYLLGLGANVEYFWYHPSIFKKVGVEPPKTFDDFFKVCDALKAQGIAPLACSKEGYYPLLRLTAMIPFRMTGNQFIDDARIGKTKFNSDVGMAAAIFTQKLGKYFQDGWAGVDITGSMDYFLSGGTAMIYTSTSRALQAFCTNQELKDDIAFFPLPILSSNDATAATDCWGNPGKGIAMLKSSMSDQMTDYVKFFITNFGDVALENKFFAGLKPSSTEGFSDLFKKWYGDFNNINTFAYCWDVRVDTSTCEVLKREVVNLALGTITPEEFAKRMDDAVAQYAPAAFNLK